MTDQAVRNLTRRRGPLAAPSLVALGAVVAGASFTSALAQPVAFYDNDFDAADWRDEKIMDTTWRQRSTYETECAEEGGNSANFRRVTHSYRGGAIIVAHIREEATYDPGKSGAINGVTFGYDLIRLAGPDREAVGYGPLMIQNDTYYLAELPSLAVEGEWRSFTRRMMRPHAFIRIAGEGPEFMDFSENGAPVTFGYYSSNGSASQVVTESGLDNWYALVLGNGGGCGIDWDGDGAVTASDFISYINDFFAGRGDLNGDGVVDALDFFYFLDRFTGGC